MTYSRREFLAGVIGGAIFVPSLTNATNFFDETKRILVEKIGEYPLISAVERFRQQQKIIGKNFRPTNLDKREYLRLADGIVKFFSQFQDARGAIIDPYEKAERQYATPAFACASAILFSSGYDKKILPQCIKAMDAATSDLRTEKTADKHSNFYTVMLMQAFAALQNQVPKENLARWRENLTKFSPETGYRFKPTSETNWNLVAASGEWRRKRLGMLSETTWMDTAIDSQMKLWTAYGMYRDANDPLAYDHFARYYVEDLLINSYNGQHAVFLREMVDRAAWTSLFMQSPHGELPVGGRSAHHQWNEAEQAMSYEYYAARFSKKGDAQAAGAFKRAARLALRSIGRWQRPSGELWIVKNRFDPEMRFGYDSYSFHSQYNLLTAAKLANAYLQADDKVKELLCPAEIGGFVFVLQPEFHKVFANAGGMFVEIETRADAAYNPTGLLRVHHPQTNPQLTISDGVTIKPAYKTPKPPTQSIAIGPAWQDQGGNWHSLAAHDRENLRDAEVNIISENTGKVEFEVKYRGEFRGGATAVSQKFIVTPAQIEITDTVEGDVMTIRSFFPLFLTDGQNETILEVSGKSASAKLKSTGDAQNYRVLNENLKLSRLGVSEPFRNGLLDEAYAESAEKSITYIIQPQASPR